MKFLLDVSFAKGKKLCEKLKYLREWKYDLRKILLMNSTFIGHSFFSMNDMNHNSDGSNLPIIRALLCLDSQPNGFPTVLFRLAHLEKFSCYQIEHLWILILSVKKDYVDCVVITCHHHDHNLIVILRDVDDLQVLLLVARHHQGATQAAAMLIGIPGSLKS